MADITKQFVLRLPVELVEEVDARAKEVGISRNQWFERCARWGLDRKKQDEKSTS
jgi:predicted HicB family RNase H-like nuclease